ncbi:RES domain-containing protein [Paenibacillus sp. TRM 82003]|nr:RES domain-containing protein [Paenibacillus sp. TRM 82003]MCI3923405.1 RES domain-containing protein [Paenibacillus sp. TRM 82003]
MSNIKEALAIMEVYMSVCCVKCFEDVYLINKIRSNKTVGNCNYCGYKSQSVIEVTKLTEDFEVFFELYDVSQQGGHWLEYIPDNAIPGVDSPEIIVISDLKPFHQHIQDDWIIFSNLLTNKGRLKLLSDILSYSAKCSVWSLGRSGDIIDMDCAIFFDNYESDDNSSLWRNFCDEIKTRNRFILRSTPINEVEDLLNNKRVKLNEETQFFRAQIGYDIEKKLPFSKERLGKAPPKFVSDGRANPRGISYLYVASDIDTAVAEVRPWKSALVSVATFSLTKDIEIVDLTLSKIESPFYSRDIRREVQLQQLLEAISLEFSKPVGPADSWQDYLPTQYISELIKVNRYEGFKFKSSIATGDNFVFFRGDKLDIVSTSLHQVNDIEIKQSQVTLGP